MATMKTDTNAGFTLLEVMVAVSILGFSILAMASMLTTSMDRGTRARRTTMDTVAAGGQLERLLALPYHHDMLVDSDGACQSASPDHGPFVLAGRGGTIEWEVCDDYAGSHAKRVTVTIRRSARSGVIQSVRYDYLKVKGYGL